MSRVHGNESIGIFDSGIGGLTVMRELIRRFPGENFVYFGDTARVPYGSKSADVVRRYAMEDARLLVDYGVKMIVVACNTVSSVALNEIQEAFSVPTIGVIEPGARASVEVSKTKRIGVIGTRATILANTYTEKIHMIDKGIEVIAIPCPLFVPIAEEGWEKHHVAGIIAEEYLAPMKKSRIDTLILGCTHYPILRGVIQQTMGNGVQLVESGQATAEDVQRLIESRNMGNRSGEKASYTFFVSDIPQKFQEIAERFLGMPIESVKRVDPAHPD